MSDSILCSLCGHDIDQHRARYMCSACADEIFERPEDELCKAYPSEISSAYASERARVAWRDGYSTARLFKGPESVWAVEAAARALSLAGWTCYDGDCEPEDYYECEDCQELCRRAAKIALKAAE